MWARFVVGEGRGQGQEVVRVGAGQGLPRSSGDRVAENGGVASRLCHVVKGACGYQLATKPRD